MLARDVPAQIYVRNIAPLRARIDGTDRCRLLTAKVAIRTNAPWWDRNLSCLPIIALMLVKESSDLTLQRSCMVQLTH